MEILLIFLVLYLVQWVSSDSQILLKAIDSSAKVTWVKPETYYFNNIHDKMKVIMQPNCTNHYKVIDNSQDFEVPRSEDKLHVIILPIDKELYSWWKNIPKPKQMRVDPNLCEVVNTKKKPIFGNRGCQLPHYMAVSAPRCQTSYLKWICEHSQLPINQTTPNHFVIPESNHATWVDPPTPYILVVRNAFSTMCGQLKTACGVIHSNTNCMSPGQLGFTDSFAKKCSFDLIQQHYNRSVTVPNAKALKPATVHCLAGTPFGNEVSLQEVVFVVAQVDDTYIYHIHLEVFPRIVYHLALLQRQPAMKILIACDSKNKKAVTQAGLEEGMRSVQLFARFFGLDPTRFLVHQHIHAKEVYLPMEGACQDAVFNTWHVLHMRSLALQQLHMEEERTRSTNRLILPPHSAYRPVIVLLKRSATSAHTRNKFDLVRQWSEAFTDKLFAALQTTFPAFDIVLYSDRNDTLMTCFACQVKLLARADVLIGMHGAALSMMLYMPPNSAVVEIAPYGNDGRCLLGGGPFSRLAAVLAHNYLIHHPLYEEFVWKSDRTSEFNITRFITHTDSFLRSIDFI